MTTQKKSPDTKQKKIKIMICLAIFVIGIIWQAYEFKNAEKHYYKNTPQGKIEITQEEYNDIKEQNIPELPEINQKQYEEEKIKYPT